MKKVKTLTFPETKEITSVSFSGCSKYLSAQGSKPDWPICLWAWEKGSVC